MIKKSKETLKKEKDYYNWKKREAIPYLVENYGFRCNECGVTYNLEIDHIVPRSHDASRIQDVTNIQFLCRLCHTKKHTGWDVKK